jgi:hypothetical protein
MTRAEPRGLPIPRPSFAGGLQVDACLLVVAGAGNRLSLRRVVKALAIRRSKARVPRDRSRRE